MEKPTVNKLVINPLTGGLYYDKKWRKNPTENQENGLNPLYRPVHSKLPYEERLNRILKVGEECQSVDELKELLKEDKFIYCYDGFEPSGRMHIAQGLLKVINVNRLIDSGCIFVFWVADWFAMLNEKMMGDLDKIRTVGKYFIEIWKAAGMKMSNVKFLWCSDFINQRPDEYWMKVMTVAKNNSLNRIKKCSQIMGRKNADSLSVAQMFYPCMQCTDIFFMDIDICQLGMDQRKVNMLAREQCKKHEKKPIVLSSHMIGALKPGLKKMSKSDPMNAIFMEDSEEDVNKKIKKAFCVEGLIKKNPVLEFAKYFVFGKYNQFVLGRKVEQTQTIYHTYEELEKDFAEKKIYADDLKTSLAKQINQMLEPIREHFRTNQYAKELFNLTKKYQEEAEKEKAKKTKEEGKKKQTVACPKELLDTVAKMTQPGKGLLAADESHATLSKKFEKIKIETTPENSMNYRRLLFTTKGLEEYISGVILFSETFTQKDQSGKLIIDYLTEKGIVLGIKLDLGLEDLLDKSVEKYTKGLDSLKANAKKFYDMGARFAKWRCVLQITHHKDKEQNTPSDLQIQIVADTLARYAKICQENGLVPIVEPELIPDGNYTIEDCAKVSTKIFTEVFRACADYKVHFDGCLFKPHMIKEGSECKKLNPPDVVAEKTVEVFQDTLPQNLGGVFFLSGGQGELSATSHLHHINVERKLVEAKWTMSFSFGRALQDSVVKHWGGKQENVEKAQQVLLERSKQNFLATKGEYKQEDEKDWFKDESLFEKDYKY